MNRVQISQLENDFERDYIWSQDEIWLYNKKKKKAAVLGYRIRLDAVLDMVRRFSPGKRVADFACAQGNVALMLAEEGFVSTCLDLKLEFLNFARKKHSQGQVDFVQANIMDYQSPQPFDCVVMGEIIEHVADPLALLKSASRNLKSGGVLVLSTPNGDLYGEQLPTFSQIKDPSVYIKEQFHWENHLFLYTAQELEVLLQKAGFRLLSLKKVGSQIVHQMKGYRYLFPMAFLRWLDKKTSHFTKKGKDRAHTIVLAAEKQV